MRYWYTHSRAHTNSTVRQFCCAWNRRERCNLTALVCLRARRFRRYLNTRTRASSRRRWFHWRNERAGATDILPTRAVPAHSRHIALLLFCFVFLCESISGKCWVRSRVRVIYRVNLIGFGFGWQRTNTHTHTRLCLWWHSYHMWSMLIIADVEYPSGWCCVMGGLSFPFGWSQLWLTLLQQFALYIVFCLLSFDFRMTCGHCSG